MRKLLLIIYYLVISKLPHSSFLSLSNRIRIWYCSKVLKIIEYDKNSKFEDHIYISDGRRIKIGKYCRINEYVFLQGEVEIGNYVLIAPYASIYSFAHKYDKVDKPIIMQGVTGIRKVVIGDDVWIGRNVVILPGITIGEGSIICANSVVTRNIKPFSVVAGIPATLIRKRK